VEKFIRRKLKEVAGKEQYLVEILNRLAALENLYAEVDIKRTWETVRENIKISTKMNLGCYELKKHKTWFYEIR
jgi:replicative DNA helicase